MGTQTSLGFDPHSREVPRHTTVVVSSQPGLLNKVPASKPTILNAVTRGHAHLASMKEPIAI